MTNLSAEKIQEIYNRFENPTDWLDAEPFWKGMFWSETGGRKAAPERYASKADCRNLLVVTLPAKIMRSDVVAAVNSDPSAEIVLKQLEKAIDEACIPFFDEKSIFDDSRDNTVGVAHAHEYLLECARPAKPSELRRLISVARRLAQAASVALRGVVLVITDGGYRDRSYHLKYRDDKSYALSLLRKDVVISDNEDFVHTQEYRFRSLATPAPFDADYNQFADPAHADISAGNIGSLDIGAIACDMGVQGVPAAILKAPEGQEYVLTLKEKWTIRQAEKAILALVPNPRHLSSIRALPGERARHRFFVVGGKIVADTPFSSSADENTISTGSYLAVTGPAKVESTLVNDQGEKTIMRPFAETVMTALCKHRPHWIVDIELSVEGPLLANISEILDGHWFSAAEELILNELTAYQASNFNDTDLDLERGCSQSRSKKSFRESRQADRNREAEDNSASSATDIFDFLGELDEED
jgi:hypothetical protein